MTKWYSSKAVYRSETGKIFHGGDEMQAWMSELFLSFEKVNHISEYYVQYKIGDTTKVHVGFRRQLWIKGNTGAEPDTDTPVAWICEIGPADEPDGHLGLQFKSNSIKSRSIVIFGGTGAQAGPIVRRLSARNDIQIRVPTRNISSNSAQAIAKLPNVTLIEASYESENGLRTAFTGQDACYFIINTFAIREPDEYFWTTRAYEIAAQSGLKLFIYSGARNRLREQGYQDAYRNSHNVVKAHLSDWLAKQDASILPLCILYGGVYAEMLGGMLRPVRQDEDYVFAAPVHEKSIIPLMPLLNYGITAEWILEHPDESTGRFIDAGAIPSSWPEIVATFVKVTGKNARFQPLSQEEWFAGAAKAGISVDAAMPAGVRADDPAVFTFRKTFGAWWNMWKDNTGEIELRGRSVAGVPGRILTLEEWMHKTGYQGEHAEPTKMRRDAAKAREQSG